MDGAIIATALTPPGPFSRFVAMIERMSRAAAWSGAMAASGVVLAHQLAYFLARPDPHSRAAALERTGHGDWSLVVALALGLLVAAAAAQVRRSVGSGEPRLPTTALRLASLQLLAFLALEAAERSLAGGDVLALAADPAVLLGIVAQIVVAVAGAKLIAAVGRAAAAWGRRRSRVPRRAGSAPRPAETFLKPSCLAAAGAGGLRGPPPTRA